MKWDEPHPNVECTTSSCYQWVDAKPYSSTRCFFRSGAFIPSRNDQKEADCSVVWFCHSELAHLTYRHQEQHLILSIDIGIVHQEQLHHLGGVLPDFDAWCFFPWKPMLRKLLQEELDAYQWSFFPRKKHWENPEKFWLQLQKLPKNENCVFGIHSKFRCSSSQKTAEKNVDFSLIFPGDSPPGGRQCAKGTHVSYPVGSPLHVPWDGKNWWKNGGFLKSFGSPKKATGHLIMIFHWHECILPLFGVWISHTRSPKTYENIYKIHPMLLQYLQNLRCFKGESWRKIGGLAWPVSPPHSRPATVSGPTCSFRTGEGKWWMLKIMTFSFETYMGDVCAIMAYIYIDIYIYKCKHMFACFFPCAYDSHMIILNKIDASSHNSLLSNRSHGSRLQGTQWFLLGDRKGILGC